ncbi:MAG: hypothetical protein RIB45_12615 [Marivibrio sp.]|uniref:hypothetical protein n=1 Tax=Marivibrio sp. TaxID=2039719 RepID=UPI0032EB9DDF
MRRRGEAKSAARRLAAAAAGAAIGAVALTGCVRTTFEDTLAVRETPMIAGNTYDRQNALAIIYPAAERINISYEFSFDRQTQIDAGGLYEGPAWIFAERQPAAPERFVVLHLRRAVGDYAPPPGETLRLGQRRFTTLDYCLTDWRAGADPALPDAAERDALAAYLEALARRGYALSRDVYVRRYVPRDADSSGRRTDIVTIRDVMRAGYDCERLGDLRNPGTDSQAETIDNLKSDSSGSFEVMG